MDNMYAFFGKSLFFLSKLLYRRLHVHDIGRMSRLLIVLRHALIAFHRIFEELEVFQQLLIGQIVVVLG